MQQDRCRLADCYKGGADAHFVEPCVGRLDIQAALRGTLLFLDVERAEPGWQKTWAPQGAGARGLLCTSETGVAYVRPYKQSYAERGRMDGEGRNATVTRPRMSRPTDVVADIGLQVRVAGRPSLMYVRQTCPSLAAELIRVAFSVTCLQTIRRRLLESVPLASSGTPPSL